MASPPVGHNGGPDFYTDCGWVAIARAMRKHPLVGFHLHVTPCDANKGAMQPALAWIDLIMECRYQPGEVTNNGKKMQLQRGQLVGATSWLADRWNWTPKTVRNWLEKLEKAGMISFGAADENKGELKGRLDGRLEGRSTGRSTGRFANIITLCNYDEYQLAQRAQGQVEGQVQGQVEGQVDGPEKGRLDAIYPRARETSKQDNKETITKTHTPAREEIASQPAQSERGAARDGEVCVGEGVYASADSVRHRAFTISLPAVSMQLVLANLGLNKTECDDLARQTSIAAALQWAAEIDRGRLPYDVLPKSIPNALRASAVNLRTQGEINAKRVNGAGRRESKPVTQSEALRAIQAITGDLS